MGLQPRNWFTLLAITALKMGARLPIVPSENGKSPLMGTKQVIKYIPEDLDQTRNVSLLRIPHYKVPSPLEVLQPQTFASIIHVSFDT